MNDMYSGVKVHTVCAKLVNELYDVGKVEIWDNRYRWPENLYLVIKDETGGQQSALARVRGDKICLLREVTASGVKPRNKEQIMALDSLLDDSVKVAVLTGKAGTGKTYLALAAAIQKIQDSKYGKVVLTKAPGQVGKKDFGILPGEVMEKFGPYLGNYMTNLSYMMGGDDRKVQDVINQSRFEFIPLQFIRGISWANTFVIADEVQNLNNHEMVTLGTRIGEGSKLVIMGDLAQRDEKIARDKTGIHKFVNHPLAQGSKFVSSIELLKCERGIVSSLFADVFEAK